MPITVPLGPAVANLTGIRAGDRNLITCTITSNGVPVDLTGMSLAAQARAKATDPDPAPITAEIDIVDAAAGQVEIRWPGDEVRAALGTAATWTGVWDLQIQPDDESEEPLTVCAGKFSAEMDVTR